jgi:4-hydroxymandelate oxidase
MTPARCRREFLRFLAASPLAARVLAQDSGLRTSGGTAAALTPADLLSVAEFEALTREKLPPSHLGYLMTGVDDDLTLRANTEAYRQWQLLPRRLSGVAETDLKVEVFGEIWDSPIFLCPVGAQRAFHNDGELAVARAARARKHVQILSTVTSYAVEDVAGALGAAPWYQLYLPTTWDAAERMVKRVEQAGCPALVWTIDLLGGRNTETASRAARQDTRDCTGCHPPNTNAFGRRPMFRGIENPGINPREADWSYVARLKKLSRMKLLIKGIDTAADARRALENGADGVIVSNHGGRATETLRSTIETLPEIVAAVGSRLPVLIDGGIRRGTDIFKALALGARAVGIGRPYIYGLASFGQAGVERVLEILRAELALTMRQCGARSIREITPDLVQRRA